METGEFKAGDEWNSNTITPGQEIVVESVANTSLAASWGLPQPKYASGSNCNYSKSFTSEGTQPQVYALADGDEPPTNEGFAGQDNIVQYLANEGYLQGGKVSLPANQVIYLFELGTTNTTSSAFDVQDNIVLATINPAN